MKVILWKMEAILRQMMFLLRGRIIIWQKIKAIGRM